MNDTTEQLITFVPDDIFAAVMLIDHACNQGAFKGWENIEKAFGVRERLLKFAESWQSMIPDAKEGTTE